MTLPEVPVPREECDRALAMERMSGRRFLAARRLVRGLLSKLLGVTAEMITLDVDSHGKPFLPGTSTNLASRIPEKRLRLWFPDPGSASTLNPRGG